MSQKLIKIKCNLTNKTISIYEDYYNKKVNQYGSEENLQKFYIQNKIINLIKSGQPFDYIVELFGIKVDENNTEYYKELIDFHRGKSLSSVIKDSTTTFMETDDEVSNFIKNWINYNNGN
jgi:hypothetical protein